MVHLNYEYYNPKKYTFPVDCLPVVFETTNSKNIGSVHFVETTKIGAQRTYSYSTLIKCYNVN